MEPEVYSFATEWDWYDLWWSWRWDGERAGNQEWTSRMPILNKATGKLEFTDAEIKELTKCSGIFDYPIHLREDWIGREQNLAPDGQPFAQQGPHVSEMAWKMYKYGRGSFNVGSADMPSGLYYTGAVGDELDAALIKREEARQRMAAQAAELDRQKITGRWANILAQLLAGVTERSRATGVPHYVNAEGKTVDQLGRPLQA